MRIDGLNPFNWQEVQTPQREVHSDGEKPSSKSLPRSSSDRVEFSTASLGIQQALDVETKRRAEFVEQIKARVDAGTYDIRAREVADAILTGSLVDKSA